MKKRHIIIPIICICISLIMIPLSTFTLSTFWGERYIEKGEYKKSYNQYILSYNTTKDLITLNQIIDFFYAPLTNPDIFNSVENDDPNYCKKGIEYYEFIFENQYFIDIATVVPDELRQYLYYPDYLYLLFLNGDIEKMKSKCEEMIDWQFNKDNSHFVVNILSTFFESVLKSDKATSEDKDWVKKECLNISDYIKSDKSSMSEENKYVYSQKFNNIAQ